MSLAKKIILLLILLLLLIIICLYYHTSDIYQKSLQPKDSTAQVVQSEFMEIDIRKSGDSLNAYGTFDSIDSIQSVDDVLMTSNLNITRDFKSSEFKKADTAAISVLNSILNPFMETYENGQITYKDGRLFISGETSNQEEHTKIEELLASSGIPYVNETIILAKKDNTTEQNEINATDDEVYPELSQEAKAVEEQIEQIVKLEDIRFELGSAKVSPDSYETIEKIANLLKENPSYALKVSGHTDNQGDSGYNMTLSKERAQNIQKVLASFGVAKERVQTAGYGDTQPLVDNDSEENRKLNRRVEFKIIGE